MNMWKEDKQEVLKVSSFGRLFHLKLSKVSYQCSGCDISQLASVASLAYLLHSLGLCLDTVVRLVEGPP